MEHQFTLKFLHTKGWVRVRRLGNLYQATVRFPYAYMEVRFNNYVIDGIAASSISNAIEMAVLMLKERYSFLNKIPREIHPFNFFLHKATFQTFRQRDLEDNRFGFMIRNEVYAISENVDGQKFFKSKFMRYEDVTTLNTLLIINYESIFAPMKEVGFTYKLIERILHKYDTCPLSSLKLFRDDRFYLLPENFILNNHVAVPEVEEMFYQNMFLHKAKRALKGPRIP